MAGLPSGANDVTARDFPDAVALSSRRSLGKKDFAKIYESDPASQKAKLTWNRPDRRPVNPDEQIAGGWHKYMPYKRYLSYVYQNGRLMTTNGEEIKLEDIPSEQARGIVAVMVRVQDAEAIESDPNLCRVCRKYSAASNDDYTRHMVAEHPEEILKMSPQPEFVPPDPEKLACCDKKFVDARGLAAHLRLKHKFNPLHPE